MSYKYAVAIPASSICLIGSPAPIGGNWSGSPKNHLCSSRFCRVFSQKIPSLFGLQSLNQPLDFLQITIGESPKRFRNEFNLSQSQVSNSVGIMQQAYGRYELDKNVPSAEVIIKIADAFGVSTDYLLGRSDTPKNPKVSDSDKKLVNAAVACEIVLKNALKFRGEIRRTYSPRKVLQFKITITAIARFFLFLRQSAKVKFATLEGVLQALLPPYRRTIFCKIQNGLWVLWKDKSLQENLTDT